MKRLYTFRLTLILLKGLLIIPTIYSQCFVDCRCTIPAGTSNRVLKWSMDISAESLTGANNINYVQFNSLLTTTSSSHAIVLDGSYRGYKKKRNIKSSGIVQADIHDPLNTENSIWDLYPSGLNMPSGDYTLQYFISNVISLDDFSSSLSCGSLIAGPNERVSCPPGNGWSVFDSTGLGNIERRAAIRTNQKTDNAELNIVSSDGDSYLTFAVESRERTTAALVLSYKRPNGAYFDFSGRANCGGILLEIEPSISDDIFVSISLQDDQGTWYYNRNRNCSERYNELIVSLPSATSKQSIAYDFQDFVFSPDNPCSNLSSPGLPNFNRIKLVRFNFRVNSNNNSSVMQIGDVKLY